MKHIILCILLAFTAIRATARDVEVQTMVGIVPDAYSFYLHLPDSYSNEGEPLPIIVHLHGRSCCGGSLSRSRAYGTLDAVCRGLNLNAVIVNPHCDDGSWRPKKLIAIVDYVIEHYNVDPDRVYVIGMSLGGYGTMDFAAAYPDRIAAAMPLCGGTTARDLMPLSRLPLWIVHGTADSSVPVARSRKVADFLKQQHADSLLIYSELPGINHGAPCRLMYQRETYDWLFLHNLKDRRVDRTSHTITSATCRKPYTIWERNRVVEKAGQKQPPFQRNAAGTVPSDSLVKAEKAE